MGPCVTGIDCLPPAAGIAWHALLHGIYCSGYSALSALPQTILPTLCSLLQTDGERLPLAVKDLGSSDIYPQSLQHSPNGRFVTVSLA